MLEKTSMAVLIFLLLWFFTYKLYKKKNYLILLPVFYMFVSLWVVLGFADDSLNQSIWLIEDKHILKTYLIFGCASISFYVGSSVLKERKNSGGFDLERIKLIFSRLNSSYIFIFYIATILLMHIAYPMEFLYFREGYLPLYNGNNTLQLFFDFMVYIIAMLLPFHKSKIVRYILFFLLLVFLQGLNKRLIILIPVIYFLGSYVRDMKFHYLKFFLLISVSLFFAAVVFSYRNNYEQGIISNIIYFYNKGLDFDLSIAGINYLFGFSFLSTLATSSFFDVTISELLVSINPLPSTIIDVSHVVENHKITVFAPYSALGTLGSLGLLYVCVYYLFAGFVFNYCKYYFPARFSVLSLLIFLLFLSFAMLSVQYQLRTTTRFIYYAIFYFTMFKLISSYFSTLKKHN